MQEIRCDLLSVEQGIICHQVNCMGVMGSGLAKAIRGKWPPVYNDYKVVCDEVPPRDLLGKFQVIRVGSNLYVCNLFGQYNYGREPGKVYTSYGAFESSLLGICKSDIAKSELDIFVPYKIASNLAGGNWEVVKGIMQRCEEETGKRIYICVKG